MLGEGYSKIDSVYFEGQRVAYYGAVFYFYGGATADISNIVTMDTQANNLGGIAYLVKSFEGQLFFILPSHHHASPPHAGRFRRPRSSSYL